MKEVFLIAVPLMAFYWFAKKIGGVVHESKKKRWVAVKAKSLQHRITFVSPVRAPSFYLLTVDAEYEFRGQSRKARIDLWDESYSTREAAEAGFRRLFKTTEVFVNPEAPENVIK